MLVKNLMIDLEPRGFTAVALLHPGWVRTDMGGPRAALDPEDSVTRMRARIARLTPSDTGRFFDLDGKNLPW